MASGGDSTRSIIRFLIGVLCAAAFLLIVLILSGSQIDETSGKAVGTAAALAFFSLTGVAGSNLVSRRPDLALLGHATAVLSLAAFVAVFGAIWFEDLFDDDWKVLWYLVLLAIAGGNVSLLLGSARGEDSEAVRLTRTATILAVALLCLMGIVEISSPGQDIGARLIGVVAIAYVLGMALLPLLRRASPGDVARSEEPAVSERVFSDGDRVVQLDHLVVAVTDWGRSDTFYRGVLGAQRIEGPEGRVAYRVGELLLNVHGPGTIASPLPSRPVQAGGSDLCFRWGGSAAGALEHLRRQGVEIVAGPVARSGARGPGQSIYFNDPDGSLIELIAYG